MKLYCFRPYRHGPKTFYVMADNKEEAFKFVSDFIYNSLVNRDFTYDDCEGWGTAKYICENRGHGKVFDA